MKLYYFLRLGRPLFLSGGFLFHALGILIALYAGAEFNLTAALWGQAAITSFQVMTHYSNEYFDLAADRANRTPTRWSGGSRILAEGHLSPGVALGTAVAAAALGLVAAFRLALLDGIGPLALPLFLLSALLAWGYSAPPLSLNARGAGEISGAILVPGLTPLVGFYLQAGELSLLPLLVIFPLCCFQFAMLVIINYPDAAGDAAAGKKTLVIRLGAETAARLYLFVLVTAYLALPSLLWLGLPAQAAAAVALTLPLAIWLGRQMQQRFWRAPQKWGLFGFLSISLLMGTTLAQLAAFLYLNQLLPVG